jgi:TonB family protein
MISPNTILQNRYQIVRLLGSGGMGTVYEALDQRLNLTVALKETLAPTEELRRAFEREARLLANLNHASLPRVIDQFVEGDGQYLVMDYISGDDLDVMSKKKGTPFSVNEVMMWADDLLQALEYLHSHQPPIIHRDIKPANIKVSAKGNAILLDFGLAKGSAGDMSLAAVSQSIQGYSANFASLEQIQGDKTTEQSDLYSLGVTLYYLLTFIKPVGALKRAAALINDEPDPLIPIKQVLPDIHDHISKVIMNAVALKPAARPKSAKEMRSKLSENAQPSITTPIFYETDEPTVIRSSIQSIVHDESFSRPQLIGILIGFFLIILGGIGYGFYVNNKGTDNQSLTSLQKVQNENSSNSNTEKVPPDLTNTNNANEANLLTSNVTPSRTPKSKSNTNTKSDDEDEYEGNDGDYETGATEEPSNRTYNPQMPSSDQYNQWAKPEQREQVILVPAPADIAPKGTSEPRPQPSTTPPPVTKTISGGVVNGRATSLPKPPYPEAARAVRASGAVNVAVTIGEDGDVESASAVSGHPLLRAAAVVAARSAKFAPITLSGQKVKLTGIIVYNFVP